MNRTKISFNLFAPYNESVELIGEFSDWLPLPMIRWDDGWWRTQVALPDGDHRYKFRVKSKSYFAVGKTIDVFDPYALQISADEHQHSIMTVRQGRQIWTEYQWKHDDVPLPENHDLVLYELFIADFGGSGERRGIFDDVIAKLPELRALGINGIELMPVKFFPNNGQGWGYNLRSLFGVASTYGTADDLCRLVDECHGLGIRVIIDGIYNHADAEAPLAQIDYAYWFHEKNPDPPQMQWGPKFNYEHFDANLDVYPARKYVIDSIRFWIDKFHIDGIRFDATRAIANFDVLHQLTHAGFDQMGGRKPFLTVAEHVPEDPAITGYPAGPMVAAWRFSLGAYLRAVLTEKPNDGASPEDFDGFLTALDPTKNGYGSGGHCVNYIVSHDHDQLMRQLAEQGQMFDDVAFARDRLGIAILATIPGIPMIWMGQEFGAPTEKSLDPRPLDWSLLSNQRNADLRAFVQKVFELRHRFGAFRGDGFEICMKDFDRRVFAFKRAHDAEVVVVLINLRHTHAGDVTLTGCGIEDGRWHEHIFDYDVNVAGGTLTTTLGPSEAKIFTRL